VCGFPVFGFALRICFNFYEVKPRDGIENVHTAIDNDAKDNKIDNRVITTQCHLENLLHKTGTGLGKSPFYFHSDLTALQIFQKNTDGIL
jgi:hypothetical protein